MKRFLGLLFFLITTTLASQNVAVKSNILYDMTATVNGGVEVGLSPQWSFDLSANFNAWNFSHDRKWKHWLLQPEVRYWFCDRFASHFLGFHLLAGQYNIGGLSNGLHFLGTDLSRLSDHRFQGWMAGAGFAYGHTWILSRHWNLEAEIGFGYVYSRYDMFECAGCGKKKETGQSHHYIGPTKAAVNLVYLF